MLDIATNSLDKMYIKSGYYRSGDEFASSFTHQADRTFTDFSTKFTFIEHISRIRIQIQNSNERQVVISRKLMEFLGLHEKWSATDLFGTDAFDPNRGLNLMYVYCDVASHAIVGYTKSPLLRIRNVAGNYGEVVRYIYERPHYLPIGRREFDSIEITINNELGEPMPFQYGKSIVTLHFRRRR